MDGRVAVVTGGGSGIGLGIVRACDAAVLAATLRSRVVRLDEIGLCLGGMSQKVVQMTFTPRNPTPSVPNEASWTLCRLRLSFGGVMHLSE
jgi:NAD(P)-dependent dehydrogenase (short-subunit alcohol dehydrogenase family)